METVNVMFIPGNKEVTVNSGTTIMEALERAGIEFDFPCGGRGKCGKCRVKIIKGVEEPLSVEKELLKETEVKEGIRLACLTKVNKDLLVELPFKLDYKILLTKEERSFELEAHILKRYFEVPVPSLEEPKPDWLRIKDSLGQNDSETKKYIANLEFLRQLPLTLRDARNKVTVVSFEDQVLGLEKHDTTQKLFGMAFDIGTTTIVGYLINLNTGEELSVVSTLNPQTRYGADVISRITYAGQEKAGVEKLHESVIKAINQLIEQAAAKADISIEEIYAVTIAGNTTMRHLFLGLTPKYIAVSPYISVNSEAMVINATELKLNINNGGKILVLPDIAGFVGADTVAVLLATEMDTSEKVRLVIDIGTNGEIALGSKEKLFTCSAAAGPAFEGAQISSGMRGAAGAIDHVFFEEKLNYSVIGEVRPQGIAGSALLDAVAGLLELGIIDHTGRILDHNQITNPVAENFKAHIIEYEGQKAFLLAAETVTEHGRPIMITQGDIRELQLAKGAILAGIKILMEKYGIEVSEVEEVLLAGAFGNYLNPHSASVIGLIPKELEAKVKMIGNAAGTGAKLALLSKSEFSRATKIASVVQFVELGSYPKFTSIFAKSMYFK